MTSWLKDFELKRGVIHVKSTGARLPLSRALIGEALSWFPFYLVEKVKRLFIRQTGLRIAFTPVVPRPWYMLWVAAHRSGARIVSDTASANAVFYFEDQTTAAPPVLPTNAPAKQFNFACTDISKTHVGDVFERIFGYALTVDPRTYTGLMAVKSEANGVHDGSVVAAPTPRQAGMAYQKLIDNSVDNLWAEDLRCPIVGGDIALIYIKRRPLKTRFANLNSSVTLAAPEEYLDAVEREHLKQFAVAMGLDWGGMDVLRDKGDGKIYVVDVNKTDMGPPISLSLKDKNTATKILTKQLLNLIEKG